MATLEELMPNLINAHEVFEQTKSVEVCQEVSVFLYHDTSSQNWF